jgi:hypothetical protein
MQSTDPYLAERTMQLRVTEERKGAEAERLARQALPHEPEPRPALGRRLAGRAGILLVTLGGRLVRWGLPPYRPARETAS